MRQGRYWALVTVCAIAVSIVGCGGDNGGNGGSQKETTPGQSPSANAKQTSTPPQAPALSSSATGGTSGGTSSPSDQSTIAEQDRQAPTQMNQGQKIAAVAPETIQAVLPETLAGMKRTNVEAERNPNMGIDLTTGKADYEGQNDTSIDLQITDIGNMSGPMRMAMTAWTMTQYNRQTGAGYEKTATYGGCQGMEEYDNENKQGTIRIIVADRFLVELNGNGVTMDTLKQALDQVDLKKIAALASGS